MGQSVPTMSQGNISGAQMVQTGMGMNQNMISGLGQSVVSSGTSTMMPTPGMSQQVQSGMQPLGVNNNSAASIPMSQQASTAPQASKYVKVWEVSLLYMWKILEMDVLIPGYIVLQFHDFVILQCVSHRQCQESYISLGLSKFFIYGNWRTDKFLASLPLV